MWQNVMAATKPNPSPAPNAQPDPRQMAAQLEIVQRELNRLDRRMEALEEALVGSQSAVTAVRFLAESSGSQEVLFGLGAGVQAKARLDAATPLLVPIGAGYATEAPAAQVVQVLEKRLAAVQEQFRRTSEEAQRVANAAQALNQELSALEM
jgi:prefoldin alpha subunit